MTGWYAWAGPARGRRWRMVLALSLLLAVAIDISIRSLPLNGVLVQLASVRRADRFELFLAHAGQYEKGEGRSRLVTAPGEDVKLVFRDRLRNTTSHIRLDPGRGAPGATVVLHITRIAAASCVGPLCWGVYDLPLPEIAQRARALHGIEGLRYRDGRLEVIVRGPDPYFDFPVDVPEIRSHIDRLDALRVRAVWLLLGLVLALLILRADGVWRLFVRSAAVMNRVLATRSTDRLVRDPGPLRASRAWVFSGIALMLALVVWRSHAVLWPPGLYIEDAVHYFNLFYGGRQGPDTIFVHGNRYLAPITNLVAWLAARGDVRWVPAIYLGLALALSLATAAAPSFSGLLTRRWVLLVAPTVLALTGYLHIFFLITLTEQIYVGIILLLCLLFYPAPRALPAYAAWLGACALLPWFGPYSAVAVPATLLLLAFFGGAKQNAGWLAALVSSLVYYSTVEPGTTRIGWGVLADLLPEVFRLLFEQVLWLDLLGPLRGWKVIVFLALLYLVMRWHRNDRLYIKTSLVLWCIVLAGLLPYFLSVKYMPGRFWPVHIQIPAFFWVVFLLYTTDRSLRRLPGYWGPVLAAALLAVVGLDTLRHPDKGMVPPITGIGDFTEAVYAAERLGLEERGEFLILRGPGDGPYAVVGRRGPDARQVGAEVLPPALRGRRFVTPPVKGPGE